MHAESRGWAVVQSSSMPENPDECGDSCPGSDDQDEADESKGAGGMRAAVRTGLEVRPHRRRDESYREGQSKGHQDQVIQHAEDRDEVRDQVDRANGVSQRQCHDQFRAQWHSSIGEGEAESQRLLLESGGALSELLEGQWAPSSFVRVIARSEKTMTTPPSIHAAVLGLLGGWRRRWLGSETRSPRWSREGHTHRSERSGNPS